MKELTCVCGEVMVVDDSAVQVLCPMCEDVVYAPESALEQDRYCDCGRLVHDEECGY